MPLQRLVFVDLRSDNSARDQFGHLPVVDFIQMGWTEFLLDGLWDQVTALPGAYIVLAPRAPHLMMDVLAAAFGRANPHYELRRVPAPWKFDLPYEYLDREGNLFISAAAWVCPPKCVEPRRCPATRHDRTWHLPDMLARSLPSIPIELFYSRTFAYGVAGVAVERLQEALRRWSSPAEKLPHEVAVATVSACHGVLALAQVKSRGR